jgi:DNA-binding beta-propeller fold protein YncE
MTPGDPVVAGKQTNRVLEMRRGAATPIVLPFSAIGFPVSLDVDAAGNLYVSDALTDHVLKLAAGATDAQVLPIVFEADHPGLFAPQRVAVDPAGNVYVTTGFNDIVLKFKPND